MSLDEPNASEYYTCIILSQTSHNICPLFPYHHLLFLYYSSNLNFDNDNNVTILDNRVLLVQIFIDSLHHCLIVHHHHCQWLVHYIQT